MIGFKKIRQRFYVIVGAVICLLLIAYIGLAIFLNKLGASAENGQKSAIIDKDVKNLEKEFWRLRLWGYLAYQGGHSDADKNMGNILENIKQGINDLNNPLIPLKLYEKIPDVFSLINDYENAFSRLTQLETKRKLNQAKIDSNYRMLASVVLTNNNSDLFTSLRNMDRFLTTYIQNRRDSEYQALRMVFDLFKTKLTGLSDNRIDSYLSGLDECLANDFMMEKQTREINKDFDKISSELTLLFIYLSQTAENLSSAAIREGQDLRQKLELWFFVSAGIFFLMVIMLLNLIAHTIINPVNALSQVIQLVKAGDEKARFSSSSKDELAELGFAFNDMIDNVNQHRFHLEELVSRRTTELVEKNDQLRIYTNELELAKKDAESANRAKSEFLANMSHEIRTPMNAVLGFSEILMGKIKDEQHRQYLRTILSSGETLLALINDILDLSKIEAGKLELEYEPVNIRRILTEIGQMFQQRVNQKGIELKTEVSDDLPFRVITDEIRMRQILINLTGNAVKFTSEGYVKIYAYSEISDKTEQHIVLTIDVQDTGIGIPENQQTAIFESFQQQEGQSTRQYGGTGLGLTITKRLTELMNGNISVQSEVGQGSIFRIRFYNVEIADQTESADQESQEYGINAEFEPAEIMIVDDIRNNRDLVRGYLEDSGLSFIEADSGEKALLMLANRTPDLIFMDLRMPGKDGYETTEIIKNNQQLLSVPVIALTASAMKDVEERIKILFDGYLRKPISKKLLIEELKKFLTCKAESSIEEDIKADEIEITVSEEHRSEIVQALNKLIPEWEEISDTFFIDDVVAFAQKIIDIAQNYNFKMPTDFGQALYDAAQSNNFSQMEKLMAEFPDFVKNIKY